MPRTHVALGALFLLAIPTASFAQGVGGWRNSRPNSNAIIYDEKGRRLYWDANGQVVGRYSFSTQKYIPVAPPREEPPCRTTNSFAETKPFFPAIPERRAPNLPAFAASVLKLNQESPDPRLETAGAE